MSDAIDPTELDALIDDCLEGSLGEPEAARLSAHLERSAEARARYWEAASIHGLLEHVMQTASWRRVTEQVSPVASRPDRWLHLRPLTAAVAGLVIGLLSAPVVFGFVVQRGTQEKVPLVVFEPGFENPQMLLAPGIPDGPAQWGGDAAHVVATENGVQAKEGRFMLRLEPASKGGPRIYQVLDLQSLPSDTGGESREIEVSASFAQSFADSSQRYLIRACAVTETPDNLDAAWYDRRDESIASATRGFDVMPGPKDWHTFSMSIQVPRAARSLVLLFGVRTPDKSVPKSFHYLDDVRVSLLAP